MQKTIQLSLLLGALLSSLHAENQYTLENISVTASQGTTLNKKDVTDTVIVITKEALEESRISTLSEALSKLGNIAMTQNGGAGANSSVFVRGMDSKRTLVLIDGVRFNDPSSLGIGYSHIMLSNVEQIEIIKGAQSGVWGGDASAGVINIVTSKAKKGLHASGHVEYGSFNTQTVSLQASYATKNYDVLLGGSLFHTDGFSTVEPIAGNPNYGKDQSDLGLEKDPYNNKSFNAKFGANITSDDRLEFNIQTIDADLKFDASLNVSPYSPADSTVGDSTTKDRFYTLAYKHTDSINDLQVQYNISTFDTDGLATSGAYELKGSVNEFRISDKIKYLDDSFVRFGGSYQEHERIGVTTDVDESFSATSAFVTNYNKLNILGSTNTIVTESIRYDSYNKFDDSLTGKIGVKQFIKNDFYISTNVGTGFNTPTISQLYGQFGANPDLKPEKSLTSDITLGNDILWLTGFYNEVQDLIEYTSSYVQTSGISKFKGIELNYEDLLFDYVGVKAMYTYLEAENADKQVLKRRPKHQLDLNAIYYISDSLDLGLNAQYIGERYDLTDKKGAQTGKYTVTDFVANYKANDTITVYAKINNLTDIHYQTIDGYATPERSYYIGLNAQY